VRRQRGHRRHAGRRISASGGSDGPRSRLWFGRGDFSPPVIEEVRGAAAGGGAVGRCVGHGRLMWMEESVDDEDDESGRGWWSQRRQSRW
jgi:hypothetical protein